MTYEVHITPRTEREHMIGERVKNSQETGEKIYDFRGGTITPKVISLPIHLPVYRMENCRAFSAQQTEIAREGLEKDFFSKGQEVAKAQQAQHKLLAELARRGPDSVTPIVSVLEKDGQREDLLITNTGVVVNGNRRLSAMRELMRKSGSSTDERFTHVRCAVLPSDTTRDEIDDIEADLQARPQTKLDYDWIGDAQLIRRQVSKGRKPKDVATRLRRTEKEINTALLALDEADLYLSEWIDKPGEYDLLSDGEQIFRDIPKNVAKKDTALQNASRAIAWSIYENRGNISGRVYRLNACFGKLAPVVLERLRDDLELDNDTNDGDQTEEFFEVEIDSGDESQDYEPIIEALRNEDGKAEVIDILVDACEHAIEEDKDKNKAGSALRTLSKVNAKIAAVDVTAAAADTLPAILSQVETIRKQLDKIEKSVKKRHKK